MLGTLITGVVFGIIFVFSGLLNFYLKAQNFELRAQIKALSKEQAAADAKLAELAETVQKSQNIPYVVNLSEQFLTTLSDRVCNRVQVILTAQNEAALKKLN